MNLSTVPSEVFDAMQKRIRQSYQFLEKNQYPSLNLQDFKIYYFQHGKWKQIKGKSVKKTLFGLWVNKQRVSRLIEVNEYQETLVCKCEES